MPRVAGSVALAVLVWLAPPARADEPNAGPPRSASSIAWTALAYLPNRVFDLCDVVRLRARFGEGFAAGARVTRYVPVFAGSYEAVWVGLPGPRGRSALPLPMGWEGKTGVDAGPLAISSSSQAPSYGIGEIGAGVQVYMIGAEAGIDVYEIADFFAGFALVDFADDDF
jgi:hypothetical protein